MSLSDKILETWDSYFEYFLRPPAKQHVRYDILFLSINSMQMFSWHAHSLTHYNNNKLDIDVRILYNDISKKVTLLQSRKRERGRVKFWGFVWWITSYIFKSTWIQAWIEIQQNICFKYWTFNKFQSRQTYTWTYRQTYTWTYTTCLSLFVYTNQEMCITSMMNINAKKRTKRYWNILKVKWLRSTKF